MKQFLIIGITAIAIAGTSCSQTPSPTTKTTSKDTVAVKITTKTKKKATKADTLKPKEVKIPKLVDLGAEKCIPCKLMAPILEELKVTYAGKFDVVFINAWKDADGAEKYKVRVIPTQIFIDTLGKELFRHEGFYSREDIMAKWKELGYEFKEETK